MSNGEPAREEYSGNAVKQKVREFWRKNPCGLRFSEGDIGTRAFYESIEKHRYSLESHIPELVHFDSFAGKSVLEVGCGMGTDGARFARGGANYTALDLTDTAVYFTKDRFQKLGLPGSFLVSDAENLPFPNGSFDLIYSHGVLHHTPDTRRAVDEIFRVLADGGVTIVMLYHKNSLNYLVNILFIRGVVARLLRINLISKLAFRVAPYVYRTDVTDRKLLREHLDFIRTNPSEYFSKSIFLNRQTDGISCPKSEVYSRKEVQALFARFSSVQTRVRFLHKKWIPFVGRYLPLAIERWLERIVGWHLYVFAKK
jgi:ubiquinone/menaquinone biosynthesis C-methylase UbiE